MAYKDVDLPRGHAGLNEAEAQSNNVPHIIHAEGSSPVALPSANLLTNAKMTQDGPDLVLTAPNGEVTIVEDYFMQSPPPALEAADGSFFSPQLIQSFLTPDAGEVKLAQNDVYNDESAIGIISEVTGDATITRTDGSTHTVTKGTNIYQGDIVETDFEGAVNIVFIDESSIAVSEDARMAIDEFVFSPDTQNGTTDVSILRGVFMYTSGFIGRENPDAVELNTPVGSIGIRGTIIGGRIAADTGESQITVFEGAIVVENGTGQQILSSSFETVQLGGFNAPIQNIGPMDPAQASNTFGSLRGVSGSFFSSIEDAARDQNDPTQNKDAGPEDQQGEDDANKGERDGKNEEKARDADADDGNKEAPNEAEQQKQDAEAEKKGDDAEVKDNGENQEQDAQKEKAAQRKADKAKEADKTDDSDKQAEQQDKANEKAAAEGEGKNGEKQPGNDPQQRNGEQKSGDNAGEQASAAEGAAENTVREAGNRPGQNGGPDGAPEGTQNANAENGQQQNDGQQNAEQGAQNEPAADSQQPASQGDAGPAPDGGFGQSGGLAGQPSLPGSGALPQAPAPAPSPAPAHGNGSGNSNNGGDTSGSATPPPPPPAPRIVAVSFNTFDENDSAVHNVAQLLFQNADGDDVPYGSISVANPDFELVHSGGNVFLRKKAGAALDFENNDPVVVTVTHPVHGQISRSFGVRPSLNDLNEAPTHVALRSGGSPVTSFDENVAVSTKVGNLFSGDPDDGDTFTYTLSGTDSSFFTITGNELFTNAVFDFESQSSFNIDITTMDSGSLTHVQNITINVNDLEEVPTGMDINDGSPYRVIGPTTYNGLVTGLTEGKVIAQVGVTDPENTNFTDADFAIGGALAAFMEVKTVTGSAGDTFLALKLKDNVSLEIDLGGAGLPYHFFVNGVLQATPSITTDANGVYSFDVDVTVTDSAAGGSFTETFKLVARNDELELESLGGNDGFFIINDSRNLGASPGARFGSDVAHTDVNGDGYIDLIISADNAHNPDTETSGGIYVIYGNSANPLDVNYSGNTNDDHAINLSDLTSGSPISGYFIESTSASNDNDDDFGAEVTNLGDINGDGFHDIATVTPGDHTAQIFLGGAAGISSTINIINIPFHASVSDISISFAGDINKDGFNDILVGAPGAETGGPTIKAGKAFVLLGGASPTTYDLSSSFTGYAVTANSPTANDLFGETVSNIGDFNNDGYDDFVVGAPEASGGNGLITVFAGGAATSTEMFSVSGVSGLLGAAVSGIGDINMDGFDDFIVSSPDRVVSGNGTGKAYVIYGTNGLTPTLFSISDLNGATPDPDFDGFSIIYGPDADGGNSERLGHNVAGAGDFNGDGVADFVITGANGEMLDEAFVIFGGSALTSYLSSNANILKLEDTLTDPSLGFKVTYDSDFNGDGTSDDQDVTVSSAGDLNHDGFDDLIFGIAEAYDDDGRAFVVYGRDVEQQTIAWEGIAAVTASDNGEIHIGNNENNQLVTGAHTDLVIKGNGGDDLIQVQNMNYDFIDGGLGQDELKFDFSFDDTSGSNVDTIDIRGQEAQIKNIEEFFMLVDTGNPDSGWDTLQISIDHVLDLLHQSDDGRLLFSTNATSTSFGNTLRFYTAAAPASAVEITSNGFTADGTETIGGETYYSYTLTGTSYEVLIDSNIVGANTGGNV